MKMLKDSSEVREARDLLLRIMSPRMTPAPAATPPPVPAPRPAASMVAGRAEPLSGLASPDATARFVPMRSATPPALPVAWAQVEPELSADVESLVSYSGALPTPAAPPEYGSASRGGRLQTLLTLLCERESYAGALVTDARGLPLATSRNLDASDSLAAFSTVLGDVLTKAGTYLGHDDASLVTLDIGERQKVVLRSFFLEGHAYYLVVICLRVLDTHRALDQTVHEIIRTLGNS
jgi:hypothetical protein